MQETHTPDGTPRIAELKWKPDWAQARQHHEQWWAGEGLVFWLTAPRDRPIEDLPKPEQAEDPYVHWYDPEHRTSCEEYRLAHTYHGADAFPFLPTWAGAGDLAAYIGCEVDCTHKTVWFEPLHDESVEPEDWPELYLDTRTKVWQDATALLETAMRRSNGRYLVSQTDLVENIDILASLRGTQNLLMDMIERPQWVEQRVARINELYFEAFDALYERIADAYGGNTFVYKIWGPGKTAKVQCDACAMFGPDMFRQFVVPAMTEQCHWLDYAMYHLDGEDALPNLDALLEIEPLQAIEWTPRFNSVGEGGGNPKWYDLYKRILKAGKSVEAITVKPDEVIPLLDAVGPEGMFIWCHCETEAEAHKLEEKIKAYR